MTTTNSSLPASELIAAGDIKPEEFWINSMGEFGHSLIRDAAPAVVETIVPSVNLPTIAAQQGLVWDDLLSAPSEGPYLPGPPSFRDAVKRAEERNLHAECIHPAELVLHRAWTHLQDLGSSVWRFYASIDYRNVMASPGKPVPCGRPSLTMCVEHTVENGAEQHALEAAATHFGVEMEVMFADFERPDTHNQVRVTFDVLGKSFGEVADLQLQWLKRADRFSLVEVL